MPAVNSTAPLVTGFARIHLANIVYRVGRKVRWDGAREALLGDAEASALLDRPRRKGYELPQ